MSRKSLHRRTVLKAMAGTGFLLALSPGFLLTGCDDGVIATEPGTLGLDSEEYDVELDLRATPDSASILPGAPSEVWRYRAKLLKGPGDTLSEIPDSYLGPTIRLRRGQTVKIQIHNELPEDTTVHWHGLHVPSDVDGQPRLPIPPGETMTVGFEVLDRAGLFWYHSHAHGEQGGRVGFQSYAGLAGLLIIEDDEERDLELPSGDNELLLVLQDRTFTGANELVYLDGGMGGMMERMRGFLGDRMLVNGVPPATRKVASRPYRVRVLNGSNARIYKLAWSDGRPVTVIGADGGLLREPEERPYVMLAPAQRLDIWVDLSESEPGRSLELISDHYDAGMMRGGMMDGGMMGGGMMGGGMMGGMGMMSSSALPVGSRFTLTRLEVAESVEASGQLPAQLGLHRQKIPVNTATRVRPFELSMVMMRGFAINGRRFEGTSVADDEKVRLGDTEIWEFRNNTPMPHPIHIHGLQFNVLGRRGGSRDSVRQGLVDSGWHDTVLVMPRETVQLAMKFERFDGLYMYHCHNMEHEDAGMMRYFRIEG
ncbi:Multicopper oxidase with three cupredoxin domains (includes cell division protein FtsP and spore coat protein CotA) [Marinobacter daqiaonensis]|uniref:Multicopper oxidase CueO n=1 Tax=Marinobacter daqiaonensis TaxID=650891 RepID=A0A1I6GQG0_9GAMM|nr:multicopper oxidase domain-containing protein [Marinobacter daqiaonensis]SFR44331.1 Multicopper oxidase with three cupredoxin domains (includes cell division protein FtsP and spore coat protein CotA) [Marinobacter daqiaonensis]